MRFTDTVNLTIYVEGGYFQDITQKQTREIIRDGLQCIINEGIRHSINLDTVDIVNIEFDELAEDNIDQPSLPEPEDGDSAPGCKEK